MIDTRYRAGHGSRDNAHSLDAYLFPFGAFRRFYATVSAGASNSSSLPPVKSCCVHGSLSTVWGKAAGIALTSSSRVICSNDSFTFVAPRLFSSCASVRGPMIGSEPLAELGASVSEIGRQGCAISGSFTRAFEEMVAMVERSLADRLPAPERRRLAVATVTAQIGAIAVSRGVAKTDMALSDEALQAVRETIDAALTAVTARSGSD
jgi:hypothetical protein